MVIGSSLWEEAREFCVGKQKRKTSSSVKENTKEYIGPDTSSLTAFLVSLLSLSDSSDSYEGNEKDTAEGGDDGSEGEQEGRSASSSSQITEVRNRGEIEHGRSVAEYSGRVDAGGVDEGPCTSAGEDCDSDWQLISEKDLTSSKMFSESPAAHVPEHDRDTGAAVPLNLPAMSAESSLLTEDLRSVIYSALPTLAQGRQWVLLYSTLKHGISLRTLYRKSGVLPGPCLLVAGDRFGAVFGGLLSAPLKPTPKRKYQGTNESFVFTNVTGSPQVFRSTGGNRYYVLCTNEAIAFGGGGHFALHLDSELLYGSSAACQTYGNLGLATSEDFLLKNVELWGFAHTSRYTPRYASFKEPEIMPGIYTW